MSQVGVKGGEGDVVPANTIIVHEGVANLGRPALWPRQHRNCITRQIHSDSQKRRLFCVFRFAPFYTNQPSLLPAGDLRRYALRNAAAISVSEEVADNVQI